MLLELKAMLVLAKWEYLANWVVWLFAKGCELLDSCLTR